MTSSLRILACFLALTFAASLHAADPSGTWTFATPGRDRDKGTSTLVLKWDNNRLTGRISNRAGEAEIRDATFVDNHVRFTVKRRIRLRSLLIHYEGVLAGDTLRGTIQTAGRRRETPLSLPWEAQRAP